MATALAITPTCSPMVSNPALAVVAVAVYAAGGRKALSDRSREKGGEATLLLEQLK